MKKTMSIMLTCLVSMMLFAGIASAHVGVYPKETTQGSYEKFTVRVPNEKDIATVKVELKISDDVTISRFEPKADWKYELTKDATGKITSVVWTTTGTGLSATEFGEFNMQGKVGDNAAEIVWKAYQTYEDGSVVEWIGADGADKPASVTTVKAKPTGAAVDGHGHTTAGGEEADKANNDLPLYFSIAALVLGFLALIISLRKKAK